MTEPADIIEALRQLFLDREDVTAVVAQRIYGGELPQDEVKEQPRPALLIQPSGGTSLTGGSFIGADAQRIDLFAFGATLPEAARIAAIASRTLGRVNRQSYAGVLIHWANSAGGYSNSRDPDGGWPRAFRSFQVFHALDKAA